MNFILYIVIILITIGIACYANWRFECKTAIFPMICLSKANYPIIKIGLPSGKDLTFLIDSGSNLSYIKSDILEEIKQTEKPEFSTQCCGIDGNFQLIPFYRVELQYKNQTLLHCFGAGDIAYSALEEELEFSIDGIIGGIFLSRYLGKIDYENERVILNL